MKTMKLTLKALAICAACVAIGVLSVLGALALCRWEEARQQIKDVVTFVTDAEGDLSDMVGE